MNLLKKKIVTRVKTAKGRKLSSTRWLHRQLNDPYVEYARKDGYRSRSAYKLIEINSKFNILKKGFSVLDLGSFPGGWSKVAAEIVSVDTKQKAVFSVDVQQMPKLENVEFIKCDIIKNYNSLISYLHYKKFNVVLSDMAPQSCGNNRVDHTNIICLCDKALEIALIKLLLGGSLVLKILQGEHERELIEKLRLNFNKIKYFKPKSSRASSSEIYLIAMDFNHE